MSKEKLSKAPGGVVRGRICEASRRGLGLPLLRRETWDQANGGKGKNARGQPTSTEVTPRKGERRHNNPASLEVEVDQNIRKVERLARQQGRTRKPLALA
jgi:hypothetical protein